MRLTNLWPSDPRSNWNLEVLVFEEGGKPENPEKNPWSKDENQQQTFTSTATVYTRYKINFTEYSFYETLNKRKLFSIK